MFFYLLRCFHIYMENHSRQQPIYHDRFRELAQVLQEIACRVPLVPSFPSSEKVTHLLLAFVRYLADGAAGSCDAGPKGSPSRRSPCGASLQAASSQALSF
jgi:hypothetical protein